MPIISLRDRQTGFSFPHVIPIKGECEYAAGRVYWDMVELGHSEVVIKCDQENSIKALRDQIRRVARGKISIIDEEPPVKESQSNGLVENNIRMLQSQIRTLRSALESTYQNKVDREHPSLLWPVEHASQCTNRYSKGKDGRTG